MLWPGKLKKFKHTSLSYTKLFLSHPLNWKLLIINVQLKKIKTKVIYLYSKLYYFKVVLLNKLLNVGYDVQTFTITLRFKATFGNYVPFFNHLKLNFHFLLLPFICKLKFKGKGYYLFKNKRNTITPQFGFSHRIYVYAFSVIVKFLNKTTVFLFGLSKKDVLKISYKVKSVKKINIFTGRGVRFSKQVVYKKVGKVSSYR